MGFIQPDVTIIIYCRALDIRTKAYGPDHHDVGQTLLSYSAFLLSVDAKRSADAAKRAVEIMEVKIAISGLSSTDTTWGLVFVRLGNLLGPIGHRFFRETGPRLEGLRVLESHNILALVGARI